MEAGVDGLLHEKTRKPGKPPVPDPVVAQLIARTLAPPPGETTHWTSRAMAKATGLAVSTVQKVWRADEKSQIQALDRTQSGCG
jgi:hypothetical protein